MNARKLQALRALAERPGTEAEGRLAREILERYERGGDIQEEDQPLLNVILDLLRHGASKDECFDAIAKNHQLSQSKPFPTTWRCACGSTFKTGGKCSDIAAHDRIAVASMRRFPKGTRVYYNQWAYDRNCPGVSTGYVPDWNWIRVKFDHLKTARNIPTYSAEGWHLSTEPITDKATLERLRGGMEQLEEVGGKIAEMRRREGNHDRI